VRVRYFLYITRLNDSSANMLASLAFCDTGGAWPQPLFSLGTLRRRCVDCGFCLQRGPFLHNRIAVTINAFYLYSKSRNSVANCRPVSVRFSGLLIQLLPCTRIIFTQCCLCIYSGTRTKSRGDMTRVQPGRSQPLICCRFFHHISDRLQWHDVMLMPCFFSQVPCLQARFDIWVPTIMSLTPLSGHASLLPASNNEQKYHRRRPTVTLMSTTHDIERSPSPSSKPNRLLFLDNGHDSRTTGNSIFLACTNRVLWSHSSIDIQTIRARAPIKINFSTPVTH